MEDVDDVVVCKNTTVKFVYYYDFRKAELAPNHSKQNSAQP